MQDLQIGKVKAWSKGLWRATKRMRWLGKQLAATGAVTIADAARQLRVSEMTVRRDLAELEERGAARRVRGGAKAIGQQAFAERRHTMAKAKARIAAKLADLVPPTGAIAFDASSTVMRLATGLAAARDLIVLTNGPDTFASLQGQSGVTPLLTGGRLDVRTSSLVGPLACRAASEIAADRLFTSAAAVSPELGALEAAIEEAEVKRAMAAVAEQVILAVDSSKLGTRAIALTLEWGRIDMLVTELDPTDELLAPYRGLARLL